MGSRGAPSRRRPPSSHSPSSPAKGRVSYTSTKSNAEESERGVSLSLSLSLRSEVSLAALHLATRNETRFSHAWTRARLRSVPHSRTDAAETCDADHAVAVVRAHVLHESPMIVSAIIKRSGVSFLFFFFFFFFLEKRERERSRRRERRRGLPSSSQYSSWKRERGHSRDPR